VYVMRRTRSVGVDTLELAIIEYLKSVGAATDVASVVKGTLALYVDSVGRATLAFDGGGAVFPPRFFAAPTGPAPMVEAKLLQIAKGGWIAATATFAADAVPPLPLMWDEGAASTLIVFFIGCAAGLAHARMAMEEQEQRPWMTFMTRR